MSGAAIVTIALPDLDALDALDRAELSALLGEALAGVEDDAAWRPLMRARRLIERARLLAEREQ